MQIYEKIITVSAIVMVLGCLAQGGPTNLKNEVAVADRQAESAWLASTNYISEEAYAALVSSATKVSDLRNALLKKSASYNEKEKQKKEHTDKIKKEKSK